MNYDPRFVDWRNPQTRKGRPKLKVFPAGDGYIIELNKPTLPGAIKTQGQNSYKIIERIGGMSYFAKKF